MENLCKHQHVELHSRLVAAATLYEPAEYEQKGYCRDCSDWLDVEDIPDDEDTELVEVYHNRRSKNGIVYFE